MTDEFKARARRQRTAQLPEIQHGIDVNLLDRLMRDSGSLGHVSRLVQALRESPQVAGNPEQLKSVDFVCGFLDQMRRAVGVELELMASQAWANRPPPAPPPGKRPMPLRKGPFKWMAKDKDKY